MKNTLLENFYTETSTTFSEQNQINFTSQIHLNSEHPIYKGHFAQIPITPGVCLTQIIKEILMEKLQKELVLTQGDNIKFLAMINPKESPDLELNFTLKTNENGLEVVANYSAKGTTYTKFKGKFQVL
jgi:3-hydroxyacyl-[acyl-carrier-protein] dehydratase